MTRWGLAVWVIWAATSLSNAGTYKLNDGQTFSGEPIAPDAQGVIIKLDATSYTGRIAWTNFTEAALRELAQESEIKKFVSVYLFDEEELSEPKEKRTEVSPSQVPRLTRPEGVGFTHGLGGSTVSVAMLGFLYLVNLYAGYTAGCYRRFRPVIGVGAAALIPVLGPILLLSMPPRLYSRHSEEAHDAEGTEEEAGAERSVLPTAVSAAGRSSKVQATIYERGKHTFNRRFFETKLAGFLRTVPSEEEKDLVLVVESARGTHVGTRIVRIMPNEINLLVTKGGASTEVALPFHEIKVVTVKTRDD